MATSYVMEGAAKELQAAYERDQYQANSYASARALRAVIYIATDAGSGAAARGFWTWLVGSGAAAAVGSWAGKNWDRISAVLNVNGADTPEPGREQTPTTNPENFDRIKGSKAKIDKDTGEVWEHDQLHKDHWEVYDKKKDWEKGRRDSDVWDDGRPKRKF